MKTGTGHRALGIGGKARYFGFVGAACIGMGIGGCQFNSAPINTKLSRDEIVARMQQRFYLGQSAADVQAQLASMDLTYAAGALDAPELTQTQRGLKATVKPGGLHGDYMAVDNKLLFWFTPEDRLAGAAYRESKLTPEGFVPIADTPIVLGAGPEKAP